MLSQVRHDACPRHKRCCCCTPLTITARWVMLELPWKSRSLLSFVTGEVAGATCRPQ